MKNEDFDESLYINCLSYVKFYDLFKQLKLMNNYDVIDDYMFHHIVEEFVLDKVKKIVDNIRNESNKNNQIIISKDVEDRFNYSFEVKSVFATISDLKNANFTVRVHQDDVDALDELLNQMNKDLINLKNANNNLLIELINKK